MKKLVNISVYAFNKSYDYQSVCDPGEEPAKTAAPRSVFVVCNIYEQLLNIQ